MSVTGPFEHELKYLGLSTDIKPTEVSSGTKFYETDTGNIYIYTGLIWSELPKDKRR
jgi:hypothetical protein